MPSALTPLQIQARTGNGVVVTATTVDNDSWDAASSGYGSVTDPSTGTTSAMGGSPTFSSVMTPAQSLAWNLRYPESEMGLDAPAYRRQGSVQSSCAYFSFAFGAHSGR